MRTPSSETIVVKPELIRLVRRMDSKKWQVHYKLDGIKTWFRQSTDTADVKAAAAIAERMQALQSTGYFARPFASWERGSNENFNGLLRQYVPKKRSMNTVDTEEITMIQNRLNNRPRKRLGFKTPAEVFHQSLKRVALRTWIRLLKKWHKAKPYTR